MIKREVASKLASHVARLDRPKISNSLSTINDVSSQIKMLLKLGGI